MKTFLNRLLVVTVAPLMLVSVIVRKLYNAFKEIGPEFISIQKGLWRDSAIKPRSLEQKKQDLLNKLHPNMKLATRR